MQATDIIEIHQLLGLYGHVLDAHDWDRLDELFTRDAVLDYTGVRAPRIFYGLDEIRDFFRDANHPSAHHVTNIVVLEVDDEVRVHSKFFVPYTRASHTPRRLYGGDYHDVVVATSDGWRFRQRSCSRRWQFTPGEQDDVPEHRRTW